MSPFPYLVRSALIAGGLTGLMAACKAPQGHTSDAITHASEGTATVPETPASPNDPATQVVTDPPYAKGQSFTSLDGYLDYLRRHNAPIDGTWYEEVRPGVLLLRRGNFRPLPGDANAPVDAEITRQELAEKLGFGG